MWAQPAYWQNIEPLTSCPSSEPFYKWYWPVVTEFCSIPPGEIQMQINSDFFSAEVCQCSASGSLQQVFNWHIKANLLLLIVSEQWTVVITNHNEDKLLYVSHHVCGPQFPILTSYFDRKLPKVGAQNPGCSCTFLGQAVCTFHWSCSDYRNDCMSSKCMFGTGAKVLILKRS